MVDVSLKPRPSQLCSTNRRHAAEHNSSRAERFSTQRALYVKVRMWRSFACCAREQALASRMGCSACRKQAWRLASRSRRDRRFSARTIFAFAGGSLDISDSAMNQKEETALGARFASRCSESLNGCVPVGAAMFVRSFTAARGPVREARWVGWFIHRRALRQATERSRIMRRKLRRSFSKHGRI